jgi:hypothetical protein
MRAFSLAPYTVRVKGEGYEPLDSFGEGKDLILFLKDQLSRLKGEDEDDQEESRLLSVREVHRPHPRRLNGVLEVGDYGREGVIKHRIERRVVLEKQVDHADMSRYYFLFSIPTGRTKGIVLLQKIGAYGIATAVQKLLVTRFKAEHPDYRLDFKPLSTEGVFDHFMENGHIRKVRFVRFNLPKTMEKLFEVGHEEIKGSAEVVIRLRGTPGASFTRRIRKYLSGEANVKNLIELGEEHFEPNNVKFEMSINGKQRTLSMADPTDIRGEFDVTSQVKLGRDNNPLFASIDNVANDLLSDLENDLYGKGGA